MRRFLVFTGIVCLSFCVTVMAEWQDGVSQVYKSYRTLWQADDTTATSTVYNTVCANAAMLASNNTFTAGTTQSMPNATVYFLNTFDMSNMYNSVTVGSGLTALSGAPAFGGRSIKLTPSMFAGQDTTGMVTSALADATKYLKADGTWEAGLPKAGGTMDPAAVINGNNGAVTNEAMVHGDTLLATNSLQANYRGSNILNVANGRVIVTNLPNNSTHGVSFYDNAGTEIFWMDGAGLGGMNGGDIVSPLFTLSSLLNSAYPTLVAGADSAQAQISGIGTAVAGSSFGALNADLVKYEARYESAVAFGSREDNTEVYFGTERKFAAMIDADQHVGIGTNAGPTTPLTAFLHVVTPDGTPALIVGSNNTQYLRVEAAGNVIVTNAPFVMATYSDQILDAAALIVTNSTYYLYGVGGAAGASCTITLSAPRMAGQTLDIAVGPSTCKVAIADSGTCDLLSSWTGWTNDTLSLWAPTNTVWVERSRVVRP